MNAMVLSRLTEQHRVQLAELRALLVLYREALEDAGVEPPTADGAEALSRFRMAFEAAGFDDPAQHPELLADWAAVTA